MQDGLRNVHSSMIQRCENPKRQQYSRYGGRGIKVCEEWHNYEIFRKWALENGYKHPLKLDRIDNNGNYEPSNCRWVTNTENCRNKSNNITLVYEGEEKCVKEWCEIYPDILNENTIYTWVREYGTKYAESRLKDKINGVDKSRLYENYGKKYSIDIVSGVDMKEPLKYAISCIEEYENNGNTYFVNGNVSCRISVGNKGCIRAILRR